MNRYVLSVVMTGVLALGAYSFSNAQQPEQGPGGRGPGGFGRGHGRGAMAALRGVELTEQQRTAVRAILEEARKSNPPDRDAGRGGGLRHQLEAEIFTEAPDAHKITTLQQQLVQEFAERLAREVAVKQKVATVLTAEQLEQMRKSPVRNPRS
jgi:Spy/CpxP family protein refolding chaperone